MGLLRFGDKAWLRYCASLDAIAEQSLRPEKAQGFFRSDQMLPIQGSHLCRNANHQWPEGLGGAYERVVGRLESVSGELLALAMRETGFF
jgi:hypothetical protein